MERKEKELRSAGSIKIHHASGIITGCARRVSTLLCQVVVRRDDEPAHEVFDERNIRLDHDDRSRAEYHLRQALDWLVGSCLRIDVSQNRASAAFPNAVIEQ